MLTSFIFDICKSETQHEFLFRWNGEYYSSQHLTEQGAQDALIKQE